MLSQTLSLLVPTVLAVSIVIPLLAGCGTASPRFGSGGKKAGPERAGPEGGARAPAAEERREDRETRAADADKVLSGARSFKTESNPAISNLDRARMMRQISMYMGTPYKLGGESGDGLDCSGYTMIVYLNSLGKKLPRSTAEQFRIGRAVRSEDLKFGDLLFFNTTGESASHVGIYLGDDLFAHASVSLGVTISSLESPYYKKRYEGARRIVE